MYMHDNWLLSLWWFMYCIFLNYNRIFPYPFFCRRFALSVALRISVYNRFGVPILHDTNLDVTLDLINRNPASFSASDAMSGSLSFGSGLFMEAGGLADQPPPPLVRLVGRVVNPLKISLSRNQYHQVT